MGKERRKECVGEGEDGHDPSRLETKVRAHSRVFRAGCAYYRIAFTAKNHYIRRTEIKNGQTVNADR
jgi:hypothetical protein